MADARDFSYLLDFDNDQKPKDQVFEDNGIKIVTDMKSLCICWEPHWSFRMVWVAKVLF